MNFLIIPILFGNNMDTLFGVENDVYIIYNLFYKYHLDYPNKWHKPYFFLNEKSSLSNIKDIIINYNNYIEEKIIFIIYFSGHSNSKGYLKFYNNNINSDILLNYFNEYLTHSVQLYFIIDSCYSKNFILNINNYNNIEKIYFIGSCNENEKSKEIEIDYDITLFKYKNIKSCKNIIVGIFTLYFVKLLILRKIDNIIDFKNIIDDRLWKMISNKYNQTIYYVEL
jgi:hypothetical protein